MSSKSKQTIILGGLIGSAGIFVSKLLGIIYVTPLTAMAGSENMKFYGYAYEIYNYLLQISQAGIPFGIAAMVAKYSSLGDYKATLMIRKLSNRLILAMGFLGMMFLMVFATPLAKVVLGNASSPETIEITRNVFIMMSFALFLVPVLSALRGFYQGLKEMEVYAKSQVIEQFARIFFLLSAGALAVYVFKQNQLWAIYFAVLSAAIGAVCAFIHMKRFDTRRIKGIQQLADEQTLPSNTDARSLFSELIKIAIPYLLVALVGFSNNMIDFVFYTKTLEATGLPTELCNYIFGTLISVNVNKVTSIPQMLAPGFSLSIIPYVTISVMNKKWNELRKNVSDCVDSVLYIAVPLSFCLLLFSKEILFLLFGESMFNFSPQIANVILGTQAIVATGTKVIPEVSSLVLGSSLLQWHTVDAFFGTLAPLFTSLMMAVGIRKQNLINLLIGAVVKIVFEIPCIRLFGMQGAAVSNLLSMLSIILLDCYFLSRNYQVKWLYTIRKTLLMIIGVAFMAIYVTCLNFVGVNAIEHGRIWCLFILGFEGLSTVLVYVIVTSYLQLPQTIFKINFQAIKNKLLHKIRRA